MNKLLIALCLLFCMGCGSWVIRASGEVEKVEYLNGGGWGDDQTIVYFKNGSSFVIPEALSIPSKRIKILQLNGPHRWKVESY